MKQNTLKSILLMLAILAGLAACKKDPVEEPPTLPPQQELPTPLPANARVSQLKWADNDFQSFTYNAKGQVSKLYSQWQYVEGDPAQIKSMVYDFQYDAQDRPVRVDASGGFAVQYFYHGNLIERTKELYPDGSVAKEVTYIYAGDRVVQEVWRVSSIPGETVDLYRHDFSYDANGNLARVKIWEQMEDLTYKLLETIEYSNFDDKINPASWMSRYPYLPQMRLQFNNPGKEVRLPAAGQGETITYTYEYNAQGLPVSKHSTRSSGAVSTVQYHY